MVQGKHLQRVLALQIIAFGGMLAIIWLDETLDLPHWILGAAVTPPNWPELLTETLGLGILAVTVLGLSLMHLRRIRYLEGFFRICSFCKQVEVESGTWVAVEHLIRYRSGAEISPSLCPDCVHEHYGDFFDEIEAGHDRRGPTERAAPAV